MELAVAILSAIGALGGPFASLITALWNDAQGFFGNASASVTGDQLAAQAVALVPQVAAIISDVQTQITTIATALRESNSGLSVPTSLHVAAAAVAAAPAATTPKAS
jgi:hypothetical protein